MSLLDRREFLIGGAGAALLGPQAIRAASEDPGTYLPNLRAACRLALDVFCVRRLLAFSPMPWFSA
jgi:hypothetical protein